MQVIVARTFSPRIGKASDWVAAELGAALQCRGHQFDDMTLPFDPACPPLEQVFGLRLFEPADCGDVLVALHPPCHLTRHRTKLIWGVDAVFRNEDLMPPGYFTADTASREVLDSLRISDQLGFEEANRVCLRSRGACERFSPASHAKAEFLPLPPRRLESGTEFQPIVAARTEGGNPAFLLIALEALALSPHLRLCLFGSVPFSNGEWAELLSLHRLEGRVELRGADDWPDALPAVLAVLDLSSDSCLAGQNAIDAHGCEKPVLAFDGHAAREWIESGRNGLTVPVDPIALCGAMASLAGNLDAARELGLAGKARLDDWGANWDHAVETLTAP